MSIKIRMFVLSVAVVACLGAVQASTASATINVVCVPGPGQTSPGVCVGQTSFGDCTVLGVNVATVQAVVSNTVLSAELQTVCGGGGISAIGGNVTLQSAASTLINTSAAWVNNNVAVCTSPTSCTFIPIGVSPPQIPPLLP
jgi:hypothetical protein